jgi:hypothetical protein
MSKLIKISIVELGITSIAELMEGDAPKTCAAMWKILEEPLECKANHSIWCGRKLTLNVSEDHRVIDPLLIPAENRTVYPQTGDLLWNYWPKNAVRGFSDGVWDFMLVYGPESIMKGPLGLEACNLWAKITEGLEEFSEACGKFRISGTKSIRVQRFKNS